MSFNHLSHIHNTQTYNKALKYVLLSTQFITIWKIYKTFQRKKEHYLWKNFFSVITISSISNGVFRPSKLPGTALSRLSKKRKFTLKYWNIHSVTVQFLMCVSFFLFCPLMLEQSSPFFHSNVHLLLLLRFRFSSIKLFLFNFNFRHSLQCYSLFIFSDFLISIVQTENKGESYWAVLCVTGRKKKTPSL